MKSKIILFILLIFSLLTGCYEDDSNVDIQKITPLVIDLGGASASMNVYLLDTLEIAPIVYKIGVKDADLSYRWEISGNDIVPQVLDTTMILKAVIGVPEHSDPYSLLLTVTDNTTSLQSYEEFKVTVSAVLGQGLLVADTRDELHSDLNLVVSSNFRGGIYAYNKFNDKNSRTLTEVYSQCNAGQLIPGLVKQMLAPGEGNNSERTLTVITDQEMLRMDPHDYLLQGKNNDFFYVHPSPSQFKPERMTFDNTMYFETLILEGVVYPRDTRWGNLNYGAPLETSDYSEYEVHMDYGYANSTYPNSYQYAYFYDELNDRFLESDPTYTQLVVRSNMKTGLGKQEAIYMGEGKNSLVYTVFKSKESEDYLLYTFQPGSQLGQEYQFVETFRLNSCQELKNAEHFESSRGEKVLYYSTDKKIYAALLTEENPKSHVCFDVADLKNLKWEHFEDEEITSILLWKMNNQGTIKIKEDGTGGEPTLISAQFRMMVISLWNPTTREGKVITLPIMSEGAGVLEKDTEYWKVYTGFGRILCIAPQGWM